MYAMHISVSVPMPNRVVDVLAQVRVRVDFVHSRRGINAQIGGHGEEEALLLCGNGNRP